MMASNKFPKSVSFNLKNASDVAILNHVKKRNFSGYVKKLILADMKEKGVIIQQDTEVKPLSKFERLQAELSHNNVHDKSKNDPHS